MEGLVTIVAYNGFQHKAWEKATILAPDSWAN